MILQAVLKIGKENILLPFEVFIEGCLGNPGRFSYLYCCCLVIAMLSKQGLGGVQNHRPFFLSFPLAPVSAVKHMQHEIDNIIEFTGTSFCLMVHIKSNIFHLE